jgi:hypothetical protein
MKSYTDELAEWVKKRGASRPRRDKNLVAFLAVRADVEAAIAAGYALKTIWEHLRDKGKIQYRYETFLKHVRRHITHAPEGKGKNPDAEAGAGKSERGAPGPKRKEGEVVEGFHFEATPNKEDLI